MNEMKSRSRGLGFVEVLALTTATCAPASTAETAPESRSEQLLAISSGARRVTEAEQLSRRGNAQWMVDFGDDASRWARDGECDDPRFEGRDMTGTLLEGDRGHDATDCRRLYEAGHIRLFGVDLISGQIHFGDDSSEYARDGECDDIRFTGNGVAWILIDDERGRDATDCRRLYEAGRIQLFGVHGR